MTWSFTLESETATTVGAAVPQALSSSWKISSCSEMQTDTSLSVSQVLIFHQEVRAAVTIIFPASQISFQLNVIS